MGWMRNRRRRREAQALADRRLADAGGDVDAALGVSEAELDRMAAWYPAAPGMIRPARGAGRGEGGGDDPAA